MPNITATSLASKSPSGRVPTAAYRGDEGLRDTMTGTRLERAIGVIYRPESERVSHYFEARLPDQFDALIHFDDTQAVEPLDRIPGWDSGEPPDTYPTGL